MKRISGLIPVVIAVISGVMVVGSLLYGQRENHNAITEVQSERTARHSQTCAALPFLTFKDTATLRAYEAKIECPLVGTVPRGGGQPVLPTPTTTPKPSPTTTAPAISIPVPGPTTYVPVTKTVTVRTTKTATSTITRTPQPLPRVTVTKTCLPAGLLC